LTWQNFRISRNQEDIIEGQSFFEDTHGPPGSKIKRAMLLDSIRRVNPSNWRGTGRAEPDPVARHQKARLLVAALEVARPWPGVERLRRARPSAGHPKGVTFAGCVVRFGAMPSSSTPAGNQPERNVYTVSRLNREVRVLIERGLGVIWVEGELSNLSVPSSGHWYFSMKDRDAQLRCAMFRQRNMSVGFTPKSGQQILARGRVSLYEPRGDYQFIVEHLEEAGVGALKREFERLKAKLAAEGLFALERKRSLPRFPRRIGIVTSPTGAALRDILHILARRFPPAAVLIYPTPVQGDAAIPSIVEAIETASARAECDVLIVARGGGSIEDLWAFNDERVARAICACAIPIVSGVGHEIDFTIADFVADARAPTPSGAAELVAPDRTACLEALARTMERLSVSMRRELRTVGTRFTAANARLKLSHPGVRLSQQAQRLDELEQRLTACVQRELRTIASRFEGVSQRLKLAHPGLRLAQQTKRLEALDQRLAGAMRSALHTDRARITDMYTRLIHESPANRVREFRVEHGALEGRLDHAMKQLISRADHRLGLAIRTLNTVSPLATLGRGFALVKRVSDGKLITDSNTVSVGDEIEARLANGTVTARVTGKE
ncbi:MAG: exodeoxyribonuclease large subunit, partial [Gammaproteobacteria bacterium]|nr:exodeoxyribonuclease large subunit [Gammaproteobacteria bacterium]